MTSDAETKEKMGKAGRGAALGAALVALTMAAMIAAAPAGAATYKVIECTPSYGGIEAPDAEPFASGIGPSLGNLCTALWDYIALTAGGQDVGEPNQGATNGWRFSAPAATQFVSAVALGHGGNQGGVFPEIVSANATNFQWAGTGASMDASPGWLAWHGEGGAAAAIEFRVRCVVNPGCGPSASAFISVQQLGFTLEESSAPTIAQLGGPVPDSGPHRSIRGTVGLAIRGVDAGSGLNLAYVDAYGERIAGAGFGCDVTSDGQGRELMPCPRDAGQVLSVNTANPAFHTGVNRLTVCVADFAGLKACREEPDVRIDNACPDAGLGVASLAGVGFRGGGSNNSQDVPTTRFGRKVKLRGRALDGNGNPVAGASICVGHHLAGDIYGAEEVNWTKTGPSGRFRFKLQRGPSKDYRVAAWQGDRVLERYRTLLVKAKPKLTIKGKARPGKRLRLRVALNPPVIGGKTVRMQAKSNAGWVGVPRCNGQTDSAGRFGCRARIPYGTAGARLQYRALVPRESGYPYLRGHSRVKSKRIRD